MTDFITVLDNNVKYAVYTGVNIHELYSYLEISGASNTFTTSGQSSHQYGILSPYNNDTANLQTVISAQRIRQNIICGYCGRSGNKADA